MNSAQTCTVIVTVDAEPDVLPDMEAHALIGLERFESHTGFLTATLYRNESGMRLVNVSEWTSLASYESCRDDPEWDRLASTSTFFAHLDAGRATIDVQIFERVEHNA